ncbi:hypothetical protein LCGC14_3166990 [marine sediment metagenome]|uniref:Uncharacterized protein n=1 Tax=marine sediment metagenome TaxID=412755 RepID=A0A0F8XR08_9ZZZZ
MTLLGLLVLFTVWAFGAQKSYHWIWDVHLVGDLLPHRDCYSSGWNDYHVDGNCKYRERCWGTFGLLAMLWPITLILLKNAQRINVRYRTHVEVQKIIRQLDRDAEADRNRRRG